MSGSMMGPGSKGGFLGSAGSIHSLIPVGLIREWVLTMGTYRSDPDGSIGSRDFFP